MDPTNPSILRRPIVYYEFLQGYSAREAANNIFAASKKDAVHHSTVSRCITTSSPEIFLSKDRNVLDARTPGLPHPPYSTFHDDDLRSALISKPNITTRELATTRCSKSTVSNRLDSLGFRKILSTWVPHELRESDRARRVSIAESLLLRPHREDLLNGIVTGDESWVLYVNDTRKRVWLPKDELPQPKRGLQQKKILLCCWWNCDGMLSYEFLESGTIVTATTYSKQLQKVADAIFHKYPKRLETYLLHDNARPHVATMTRQKIQELGREVLPQPPYSPDLAPSDYHLFRALKRHLRDKSFDSQEQLRMKVGNFSTQSADFGEVGSTTCH